MAGGSEDSDLTRVVIVEDTVVYAKTLVHALNRARGEHGERTELVDLLGHEEALHKDTDYWTRVDCVFLDAYDHTRQRIDRAAIRFAGLDVADQLAAAPEARPRVVGYSTNIGWPEINIPFRECVAVDAFYDPASLLDHVASALWDPHPAGQAREPTRDDFAELGVPSHARICDALRLMRSRPDAWELVARTAPHLGVEPRTREFVNDRVKPLLGTASTGYKPVVRILQRVSGLPAAV